MTNVLDITNEELRNELDKMGYRDISDDVLQQFKQDLQQLMQMEESALTREPQHTHSSKTELKFFNPIPTCLNRLHKNESMHFPVQPDIEPQMQPKTYSPLPVSKSLKPTVGFSAGHQSRSSVLNESSTSNMTTTSKRIIKRKILRHQDGESFVEELSYVSNISSNVGEFCSQAQSQSSPYPDLSQGLQQSQRLSRSTGSINEVGKSGSRKPVGLPAVQYGRKQCDPVTRYHQYRQFWDTFKPPGENSHKQLRWTIREQMLDYDPLVEMSLKQIPNMYKVPLERRRHLSRSNSTSSLCRQ